MTDLQKVVESENLIKVKVRSLPEGIMRELTSQSFLYVYFCCGLWFATEYEIFAALILATAVLGAIWTAYTERQQRMYIKKMAKYEAPVRVYRYGKWTQVSSRELKTGDVVEVPSSGFERPADKNYKLPRGKVPCDMVLIQGSAIVDESSLTGESLPVVKLKLKNDQKLYNFEKDKLHTLYSGTTVIGAVCSQSKQKPSSPKTEKKASSPKTEKKSKGGDGKKKNTKQTQESNNNNNNNEEEESSADDENVVKAVVVKTGWQTAKGNLIRSILTVSSYEYIYEKEAVIFMFLLIFVGICLFFLSLHYWGAYDTSVPFDTENIKYGLEMIAIIVPPMLPTIFQVGLVYSASILKDDYEVFTTDPSRIPLSGSVDIMCFDKTGTLTKDDLDMIGVVPVTKNGKNLSLDEIVQVSELGQENAKDLLYSLVTCHQLGEVTLSDESKESTGHTTVNYSGPTVDIKVFESTGWEYHDVDDEDSKCLGYAQSPDGDVKLEIVKRFDFDPAVQRMSAIVKHPKTKEHFVVCKGSPEMIKGACDSSTLPKTYQAQNQKHSRNGCYVLAIASGKVPSSVNLKDTTHLTREEIEKDLTFRGLILLRNELKPDTTEAIRQLKRGNIRSLIITGDNIFTAFYIAKKCGLVSRNKRCFIGDVNSKSGTMIYTDAYDDDSILDIEAGEIINKKEDTKVSVTSKDYAIGISSAGWEKLIADEGQESFLVNEVQIFARMKPLQKEAVVKLMMKDGTHVVGMSGDGANDCAALSAAHCGVALSEAEASVVSPFTAKRLSILSVADLFRIGRASLANSFAVFIYTIVYGVTQTSQALFSYTYGTDLSEMEYISIDFGMFLPSSFFIVKSEATKRLQSSPPTMRVFGKHTLTAILGCIFFMLVYLQIGLSLLTYEPWYTMSTGELQFATAEVTTSWVIGAYSYFGVAIGSSFGSRWRKPFFYNVGLMVVVTWGMLYVNVLTWMFPEGDVGNIFGFLLMVHLPFEWRWKMAVLGWALFFTDLLWFKFVYEKLLDIIDNFSDKKKGILYQQDDNDDNDLQLEDKSKRSTTSMVKSVESEEDK
eukprot:TRINITY_DN9495_c0_g1_i1.p1 TRINITY_DN9495_c0_g1~~TRINITY_DN9495_c0_g1_i1.p1  ORF type:complete len:1230 (-),score=257.90 TRINITY_DN9495_c0_g1_i1:74-3253(-)